MLHIFGVLFFITSFDVRSFAEEGAFCPVINLPNGKYEVLGQDYKMGAPIPNYALVKFSCNTDYALYPANALANCVHGKWYSPLPECRKACPPRISSSVDVTCTVDGQVVDCGQPMVEGTVTTSRCKYFYVQSHPDIPISKCSDGSWDNPLVRCVPECGDVVPDGTVYVVNGVSAKKGEFPWHVGLYHYQKGKHEYVCGGSIITPKIILTAAQCLTDELGIESNSAEEYYVAAGKYYSDYNSAKDRLAQTRQVKEYHIPPQYRGYDSNFAADLAVVVLVKPFQLTNVVQPVCIEWENRIEPQQLKANNRGSVVGWGYVDPDIPEVSTELKQLNAPFIDVKECFSFVPLNFRRWVTPDKFCAGFTNGSSICKGDSGGGIVFKWKENNRQKYYLRGLASVGPIKQGKCDNFQYAVYTKISVYYDFILQFVTSDTIRTTNCPALIKIDHGKFEILGASYIPGTPVPNYALVEFSCDTNYVLRPANPLVTCIDGSFSNPIPQCKHEVPKIKNVIDECGIWDENSPAPWNVAIYHKENSYKFRGGGSIITVNVIITAAQSMIDKNEFDIKLPAEEFYVAAGKYNIDYNAKDIFAQKIQVKEYHIPPEFDGFQSHYNADLAVVVLKTPFYVNHAIQPVCLARNNVIEPSKGSPNNKGIVVAWIRDNSFNPEIKQSNTTYIDKEQCFDIVSSASQSVLTSDKYCARYIRCGNYGGGLVYKGPTNKQQFYLQGVNSFVDKRGVCNDSNTGIFTNITIHNEFILNITDKHLRTAFCPEITIENGQYSILRQDYTLKDSVSNYELVKLTCNVNYTLHPTQPLVACIDGNWPTPFPKCKLTCPPIISSTADVSCTLDNNFVNCSQPLVEGAVATSNCKLFYKQSGHDVPITTCTKGAWNKPLITCIPECGEMISKSGTLFVVNGTSTKTGEFPWHIALYRLEKGNHEYKCGGSIINPLIVITAAHCLTNENATRFPADEYYIGAGKYYSDYNSLEDIFVQKRQVKEYYIPVEYKGFNSNYGGDLAVVVVRQAFQMSSVVQPVCVDWQGTMERYQLKPNNNGAVVGWGYVDPNVRRISTELRRLDPPYINQEQCYNEVPDDFRRWITWDKFCAGFRNGTSICEGDSGGGLVFKWNENEKEKYFLRGVVSVGPVGSISCDNFQYGVYTRMSYYMDKNNNFILNIIKENPIKN